MENTTRLTAKFQVASLRASDLETANKIIAEICEALLEAYENSEHHYIDAEDEEGPLYYLGSMTRARLLIDTVSRIIARNTK